MVVAAEEVGEDSVDVDVAVFEEDFVAGLGAGDGGADDVEVGDVGFHGFGVEEGDIVIGGEFDAGHFCEGHVSSIAGHEKYKIGGDALQFASLDIAEEDVVRGDLDGGGCEMWRDGAGFEEGGEFRVEPIFNVLHVDIGAAIVEVHVGAGAVRAEGGFDGGVSSADDEQFLSEIGVGLVEIMGDVGEIFAGDVEEVGAFSAAGGEDDAFDAMGLGVSAECSADASLRDDIKT